MFTTALFMIAKIWEQPKCPPTDGFSKGGMCTMEYYSAIRKEDILPPATTWLDLQHSMLNGISQTKSSAIG